MIKSIFLVMITFLAFSSTAFSERPFSIDLKKFTCQHFLILYEQDQEEAENDADERSTQVIMWIAGSLTENRILRLLPVSLVTDRVTISCTSDLSAKVLTVFTRIYKGLLVDPEVIALENSYEIPLSLDISQVSCQSFLTDELFEGDKKEILLSWIDGNLSKTQLIDLKKPQVMLPNLLKQCQQQPSKMILPIIKEIGNYK